MSHPDQTPISGDDAPPQVPPGASRLQSRRAKLAPRLCAAIVLVLNLAFYSKGAPTLRLVELSVCREYWSQHDPSKINPGGVVPESECKLDAIQSKVAWLFMADELLHFCCDFIATIPLGILASHFGPKPIMILNFAGLILSWAWLLLVCVFYNTFSVNLVLLASIFCIPGGATHFNTAIIYSEAALYTTDRTTTFSLLEGIIQISQLIGPVIGSSLLLLNVYAPFYFVFPISLSSLLLALALPSRHDTPSRDNKRKVSDENEGGVLPDESAHLLRTSVDGDAENDDAQGHPRPHPRIHIAYDLRGRSMKGISQTLKNELAQFWKLFTQYRVVQYANAAALVVTLGKQALHILLQYVSKRFGVKIAEAGFLLSIKAAVVLVLYVAILPFAQRTLTGSESSKSIRLARISVVSLAVGVAIIGISWNIPTLVPGLIIYAAGFGFPVLVRSMISSAATAYNLPIPLLFSGLAITETAGSFIGATLLTTAFVKTLGLHGWLQGLPFWICAVFYAAIAIPTFIADLRIENKGGEERQDNEYGGPESEATGVHA